MVMPVNLIWIWMGQCVRECERGRIVTAAVSAVNSTHLRSPPLLPHLPQVFRKEDFAWAETCHHPRQTKKQPGERQRHGKKRRGRATERRGMSWGGRDGVNRGERFNPAGSDFRATPVFSFSAFVVANGRRADVANTTPLTQTPAPSNFKSSKPVWSAS